MLQILLQRFQEIFLWHLSRIMILLQQMQNILQSVLFIILVLHVMRRFQSPRSHSIISCRDSGIVRWKTWTQSIHFLIARDRLCVTLSSPKLRNDASQISFHQWIIHTMSDFRATKTSWKIWRQVIKTVFECCYKALNSYNVCSLKLFSVTWSHYALDGRLTFHPVSPSPRLVELLAPPPPFFFLWVAY